MKDDFDKNDIKSWWAENPMTYGETHGRADYKDSSHEMGSREFFDRIDNEFYSWNNPLHKKKPFDKIFPYEKYKNKKVLEIGCGLGTMLMNWSKNGSECTGVDLNPTSVTQSKKRFEIHNIDADIRLEDANNLTFDNESFDYVWSWGVLHHSPNLELSINELFRVLKPGGEFGIMLYNRESLYQWYMTDYIEGFLHRESKFLSPLDLNSRYGDGHKEEGNPHTWPITKKEGLSILKKFSKNVSVDILGTDLDCVLKLLIPGFSSFVPKFIVKALARSLGWSLWFSGKKDL